VALSISVLMDLSLAVALFVVFGVVGIDPGGEMTYGQTFGFLRNWVTKYWNMTMM
jgi:hypothetical protein